MDHTDTYCSLYVMIPDKVHVRLLVENVTKLTQIINII